MGKETTRREFVKLCSLSVPALAIPTPLTLFANYNTMDKKEFEVIIIGGSYAGLSTAMTLGRSLRETLVIDAGKPCNRQTPHSHNFLTQDGHTPKEISEIAKSQVLRYDSIEFYEGLAVNGKKIKGGFEVTTEKGDVFTSKKLVLATGIKDIMPEIKGFSECWGISVVHCPYCHGYEIKNQKTAIIANGERASHLVSLVHNLSKDITILTSGTKDFKDEELQTFKKNNIQIIENEISSIQHKNGQIEKIVFKDGSSKNFDCAYGPVPFEQNTTIAKDLGCETDENGYLIVDWMQKTTLDGVFACGDNSTFMRSVANAVNSGNTVGAMINGELSRSEFYS